MHAQKILTTGENYLCKSLEGKEGGGRLLKVSTLAGVYGNVIISSQFKFVSRFTLF